MKITKISPSARAQLLRRQMGDYAFVRHLRNLGIPFDDAYFYIFGRNPVKG